MSGIEEVLKKMVIAPPSYEQLFESAIRRARKMRKSARGLAGIKGLEASRIEAARAYVTNYLRKLALRSPFLKEMHPFHRELASLVLDADEYKRCLALIYGAARIIDKIAYEQKRKVKLASDRREAARARRQFFARLRSVLEELDKCFSSLRKYQLELRKLPNVDPELETIIVAGPPNVGKSSLVRAVSRAKPEVREYPFTTKTIIVGHIDLPDRRIQVIDTPGLLDRPMEFRNPIELQAVLAMKHLRGVIVFLFDPSETCGYPLEYQLRVYADIKRNFPNTPCIPVANKVDILDFHKAGELVKKLSESDRKRLFFISALKKINVEDLVAEAISLLPPSGEAKI